MGLRHTLRYKLFLWTLCLLAVCPLEVTPSDKYNLAGRLIYAVNAGGPAHNDEFGVFYEADPCQSGIASDYGTRFWTIGRVEPDDAILYQTERYGLSSFGYKIPVREDGEYVLVLKFSEVYFLNSRKKVFDVFLNNVHQIVKDLDIFDKVGHGVAHDETVLFSVTNEGQTLTVNGGDSKIRNHEIDLQFVKGPLDNPKINAFYVVKGTPGDVPRLPPYDRPDPEEFAEHKEYEYEDDSDNHDTESNVKSEDEVLSSQRMKRRQRIVQRQSAVPDMNMYEDDWMGYVSIVGSIGVALLLAFVIKKIISW